MTKKSSANTFPKSWLIVGAIVLFSLLALSAFLFFRTVKGIGPGGMKHPPRNPLGMFLSGEHPMNGTGSIEGWMTFDFINNAYKLPPEYLKDILHIQDLKYPRIPIDRYAKIAGFQKKDFLEMVRRAVDYATLEKPKP